MEREKAPVTHVKKDKKKGKKSWAGKKDSKSGIFPAREGKKPTWDEEDSWNTVPRRNFKRRRRREWTTPGMVGRREALPNHEKED